MAFYLTEMADAIRDRLAADTGSGGLFNASTPLVSSVWFVRAPEEDDGYWSAASKSATSPHIVFNCRAIGAPDAQRTKSRLIEVSLAAYCKPTASTTTDPWETLGKIAERIEGNWETKAVGVDPDYGLIRWAPTITNHGTNPFEFPDSGEVIEPFDADAWVSIGMTMTTHVHRAGA